MKATQTKPSPISKTDDGSGIAETSRLKVPPPRDRVWETPGLWTVIVLKSRVPVPSKTGKLKAAKMLRKFGLLSRFTLTGMETLLNVTERGGTGPVGPPVGDVPPGGVYASKEPLTRFPPLIPLLTSAGPLVPEDGKYRVPVVDAVKEPPAPILSS
jgi:hypothetical protein